MFSSLLDLLKTRGLLLTLASIEGDRIRVTVTPRPKGDNDKKRPIVPLVVEGTPKELDAEFAQTIAGYSTKLLSFEESVNQAQAAMDEELKAIKDGAAKKIAEAKKSNKTSTTTTRPASTRPAPQVEEPAPVLSLFDDPTPAETTAENTNTKEDSADAAQSHAA